MIPGGYFRPSQTAPQTPPQAPQSEPDLDDELPVEEAVEATADIEAATNAVPPDAVSYHTGDENCGKCEYMGNDGMCSWLKMSVGPTDHCTLFEARENGEGQTPDPEVGPPV
jgi:hypothetical protein